MNKKAVTEMVLVGIVAATIGAIVFLTILWPVFSAKLKGAQALGECNWNLMLSAGVKAGTYGFGEIEPSCKAQYTTIDSAELKKYHTLANQRISKYCAAKPRVGIATSTGTQYTTAAADFCSQGKATYDDMNEWALNNIMAKKMTSCWDKVWHGKMDFFRQYAGNRSVCVVCDVTTFSDDLPVTLKTQEIKTLYDWLNAEPYYQTTYYDYLVEGQTFKPAKESMKYKTDKPLAIVFAHTKGGYWQGLLIGGIAGTLVGGLPGLGIVFAGYMLDTPDSTKQVFIMPYEDLRKICTDIIA